MYRCQSPIPPTPACYPLLSIPSCFLWYISEDRVLREEGGGGVEEGNRITCGTNDVKYHIVVPMM